MGVRAVSLAVLVAAGLHGPVHAVSFSFTTVAGDTLTAGQAAAFSAAAAEWSAVLSDPVEVRLSIGFRDLGMTAGGATILGGASPTLRFARYGDYRAALIADQSGGADAAAVGTLELAGPSADAVLTSAQARAAGLSTLVASDATIELTTRVTFAETRAALTGSSYDLIGVAAHEIGHVLGFFSSIDIGSAMRSGLDLFRYSGAGARSFGAGQAAFLSGDGGASSLGPLSVGGSGQYQASHWLQGAGGLMDPAVALGTAQFITARDIAALDLVGWDVAVGDVSVPGPASAGVLLAALGMLGWRRAGTQ
ncbi:MAG: hypothetical protein H7Z10_03090 [Gemmatimonadaceae bacterium]|nr:hypothetical protein [Acetobacteraceae bacterium]